MEFFTTLIICQNILYSLFGDLYLGLEKYDEGYQQYHKRSGQRNYSMVVYSMSTQIIDTYVREEVTSLREELLLQRKLNRCRLAY